MSDDKTPSFMTAVCTALESRSGRMLSLRAKVDAARGRLLCHIDAFSEAVPASVPYAKAVAAAVDTADRVAAETLDTGMRSLLTLSLPAATKAIAEQPDVAADLPRADAEGQADVDRRTAETCIHRLATDAVNSILGLYRDCLDAVSDSLTEVLDAADGKTSFRERGLAAPDGSDEDLVKAALALVHGWTRVPAGFDRVPCETWRLLAAGRAMASAGVPAKAWGVIPTVAFDTDSADGLAALERALSADGFGASLRAAVSADMDGLMHRVRLFKAMARLWRERGKTKAADSAERGLETVADRLRQSARFGFTRLTDRTREMAEGGLDFESDGAGASDTAALLCLSFCLYRVRDGALAVVAPCMSAITVHVMLADGDKARLDALSAELDSVCGEWKAAIAGAQPTSSEDSAADTFAGLVENRLRDCDSEPGALASVLASVAGTAADVTAAVEEAARTVYTVRTADDLDRILAGVARVVGRVK